MDKHWRWTQRPLSLALLWNVIILKDGTFQTLPVSPGCQTDVSSKEGDPRCILQIQKWNETLSLCTTSEFPCRHCFSSLPFPCGSRSGLSVFWFRKQIGHLGLAFILFLGSASHFEAQDIVCDGLRRWTDVNRCWMMEASGQGYQVLDDAGG